MAEVTGLRNSALPYPVYGVPFGITFPLLDADGDPISPSSPDSEVSKNGDTFADCTNEATEIATSSGICYLLLTATEMTADVVTVRIQSTGAKTTVMTLYPRKLVTLNSGTVGANAGDGTTLQLASGAVAIDDYYNGCLLVGTIDTVVEARVISDYVGSTLVCTVSPAFNTAPDNNDTYVVYMPEGRQVGQSTVVGWVATALPSPDTAGYPKVTIKDGTGTGEIDTTSGGVLVAAIANNAITAASIATGAIDADAIADNAIDAGAIAADAITAAKVAADVTTEIQSGLATAAELAKVPKSDGTATWNATALASLQSEANDALVAYDPPTKAELDSAQSAIQSDISSLASDNQTILAYLTGTALVANQTIGSTGNDTTHIHIAGFTYGNDEINDMLLVILDNSEGEYHSRWIADWVLATELATVATLPFTPQNAADKVWLLPIRRDVTASGDSSGVTTLLSRIGTPSDLGGGATVAANLADIESQTDDIGVAGAGLTAADDAVIAAIGALTIPSAATIADAVWDEDATAHQTGGTFGQAIGDPAADTNTIYGAVVTGATGATIAADIITIDDLLDTEIGALTTAVDALPTNAELATALGTADDAVLAAIAALNNLSASAAATAVLTTAITESYAADGAAPTLAQFISLVTAMLTEFAISGTTLTAKKLDGSTTAATFTLDSATSPTSITRAT